MPGPRDSLHPDRDGGNNFHAGTGDGSKLCPGSHVAEQ